MTAWLGTLPIWALVAGAFALWLLLGLAVGLAVGMLARGGEDPGGGEVRERALLRREAAARRRIVSPLLLAGLLLASGAAAGRAGAQDARDIADAREALPREAPPVAARFAGERFGYDVSFLFLRRAAVGGLTLEPEAAAEPRPSLSGSGAPAGAGRYVARASLETKGFVGWLDRRRHVYTSTLEPCDGGRRWCSRQFVSDLAERDHRQVTTVHVNPARGLITWTIERDGVVDEIGRERMRPGAHYDDLFTALYNFRAGVYGPIEQGRRYEIRTIPIEGVSRFTIRVLEGQEEAKARRKYGMGEGGFVVAVKIPRAIFKKDGEMVAWFSPDLVPLAGTVENYIGFGDVHGRLVAAVRPAGGG